jgi:hypothetical protein
MAVRDKEAGFLKKLSSRGSWAAFVVFVSVLAWSASALANPLETLTGPVKGATETVATVTAPVTKTLPTTPPTVKVPTVPEMVPVPSTGVSTAPSPSHLREAASGVTKVASTGDASSAVHRAAKDIAQSPATRSLGSVSSTSTAAIKKATTSGRVEGNEGSARSSVHGAGTATPDPAAGLIKASRVAPLWDWLAYVWPAVAFGQPPPATLLIRWEHNTLRLISDGGSASLGGGLTGSTPTDTAAVGDSASPSGFPSLRNWFGADPPLPAALFYVVLVGGVIAISLAVRRDLGLPLISGRWRI